MMDAGAEQHQGESHLKTTGTTDESEDSNAKGTTGSDQAEQGDAFKPQSERESPSKEIAEPDQPFESAQPCLTTINKSSGMEPDLTAEDPDVLQRKETQGETGYEQETEQEQLQHRGIDPELGQPQIKELDVIQESLHTQKEKSHQHQEQESGEGKQQKPDKAQEQESYRRQEQESDDVQEQESDQRQEQEVESEQQKEEDSEPREHSDSDSNAQLLPKQDRNNSEDRNTDKDRDKRKFKIFVIGKTGTGKSSLCNKIIGRNAFATGRSFKQVTTETQEEPTTLPGLNITVVDTPDISGESESRQKELVDSWKRGAKGYNYMVVLTVRCDARYSPAEYEVYRQIKQLWGHDFVKRLVVAFTFGDTREDQSLDMEQELDNVWPELKQVIKDANNRFVVFSNEGGNKDDTPVIQLVKNFKQLQPMKGHSWRELSQRWRVFTIVIGCMTVVVFGYLIFTVEDTNPAKAFINMMTL